MHFRPLPWHVHSGALGSIFAIYWFDIQKHCPQDTHEGHLQTWHTPSLMGAFEMHPILIFDLFAILPGYHNWGFFFFFFFFSLHPHLVDADKASL